MASDSDLDEARQLGLCHYLLTFARMHPVGDGRSHLVPGMIHASPRLRSLHRHNERVY